MTSARPKDIAGWGAWALIVITLLTSTLTFYGRFTKLEARMDAAEADRTEMMNTLTRIENILDRLEARK